MRAKQVGNWRTLSAILDEMFGSQPMAHWREVLDQAHLTFGLVQMPSEVVNDPQLRENDIVVPSRAPEGTCNYHQQSHAGARCR